MLRRVYGEAVEAARLRRGKMFHEEAQQRAFGKRESRDGLVQRAVMAATEGRQERQFRRRADAHSAGQGIHRVQDEIGSIVKVQLSVELRPPPPRPPSPPVYGELGGLGGPGVCLSCLQV